MGPAPSPGCGSSGLAKGREAAVRAAAAGAGRPLKLRFAPATAAHWRDIQKLFGPNGACAGCWCMWWRLPRREWSAGKGEGNKAALRRLMGGGTVPGIIALAQGKPVGWVAFAPREDYVRLSVSRTLKPIDARPVWSITCFFVARAYRGRGLMTRLIEAAVAFARKRGATLIEGYPTNPSGKTADAFMYTGTQSAFMRAGFETAARPSKSARIVRRAL